MCFVCECLFCFASDLCGVVLLLYGLSGVCFVCVYVSMILYCVVFVWCCVVVSCFCVGLKLLFCVCAFVRVSVLLLVLCVWCCVAMLCVSCLKVFVLSMCCCECVFVSLLPPCGVLLLLYVIDCLKVLVLRVSCECDVVFLWVCVVSVLLFYVFCVI